MAGMRAAMGVHYLVGHWLPPAKLDSRDFHIAMQARG